MGVIRTLTMAFVVSAWPALASAQIVSTWAGGTGNWSDPLKWDNGVPNNSLPATTYDATITSGAVTLNQDVSIQHLTLGTGDVDIVGGSGNTLTVNNGFHAQASVAVLFSGAMTFNNIGASTVAGNGLTFQNGAVFNNQAGGSVTVNNNAINLRSGGTHDGSFFVNLAAGGGALTGGIELNGVHTFNAASSVSSANSTGRFLMYGTTNLNGAYTFQGRTWIFGPSAVTNFNIAYNAPGELYIENGGTANFNVATVIDAAPIIALVDGGVLNANAALTLHNLTLAGTIGNTIGGTAPEAITVVGMTIGVGSNQINHALVNTGVANHNGGDIRLNGITFTNQTGATFNFNAPGYSAIYSNGVFDNDGTLNKFNNVEAEITPTFNNNAGGVVNVNAGTLTLNTPGLLDGVFNIASSASLKLNGGAYDLAGMNLTGPGLLQVAGGAATVSGPLDLSAGGLWLSGGTLAGNGAITGDRLVLSGGTINRDLTVFGVTSNTLRNGNVTIGSGFTLTNPLGTTLTADASSGDGQLLGTGGVLANVGTFSKIGGGRYDVQMLTNSGLVDVQQGHLVLHGTNTHTGDFDVASGARLSLLGTHTFDATSTISGAGTLRLSITEGQGIAEINGTATIGTLEFGGGTLRGSGAVTPGRVMSLTGGTIDRDLSLTGVANEFQTGTLSVATGRTLSIDPGVTLTLNPGNGSTTSRLDGPGAVVNTGVIDKIGTNAFTIGAAFTNAAGGVVNVNAGRLALSGVGTHDGTFNVAVGAALDLTGANGANTLTANSLIQGLGGLRVSGVNAVIEGDGGNTFSGGTNISNGGRLLLTGTGTALGTGGVTVQSGGRLSLSTLANLSANSATVNAGGVLALQSKFDPSSLITNASAGVLAINVANFDTPLDMGALGNGSMSLSSTNTGSYTAATLGVGTGDTYRFGGGGGVLTVGTTLANATSPVTARSVEIIGPGTTILAGSNTYSGGTNLNSGTLAIANAGALGTGALNINGGALQSVVGSVTIYNNVNLNADFTFTGTDDLTFGDALTFTTLTDNRTVTVNGPGQLIIESQLTQPFVAGVNYSLTKNGAGTLVLSNDFNDFSGGLIINAGTVYASSNTGQNLGVGPVTVTSGAVLRQTALLNLGGGSGGVLVESGGILAVEGNYVPIVNSASMGIVAIDIANYNPGAPFNQLLMGDTFLGSRIDANFNGTTLQPGSGGTYRLAGAGGSLTITQANVITGPNLLQVGSTQPNGAGTLVIAATQSLQGNTVVQNGSTLVLNASLGTGSVTVLAGGTLKGTFGASNLTRVQAGGVISPGNSPGLMVTVNTQFFSDSNYVWEIDTLTETGAGTAFDVIQVSGGLTIASGADLTPTFLAAGIAPDEGDPFWNSSHVWQVIDLTGSAVNSSGNFAFDIDNSAWSSVGYFETALAADLGVNLLWTPVPVPEPSTWAMLSFAGMALGWTLRRRPWRKAVGQPRG